MNPQFERFRQQVLHPVRFRFFLLQRLPAAFFAGLKIRYFDEHHATITVKYQWLNQNPFGSMYFAVQAMAAEMSTGLPGFAHIYQRSPVLSMLVVSVEGTFFKKAISTIAFTCEDVAMIGQAVEEAIATGEGRTVKCLSTGRDEIGDVVSEFTVVWSFKTKKNRL